MLMFAPHRQGQSSHVCTHRPAMAGRGLPLVLPISAGGGGYRPPDLGVSPPTGRRKAFLPARRDQVCTRGDIR
jgi:hypothetical protein